MEISALLPTSATIECGKRGNRINVKLAFAKAESHDRSMGREPLFGYDNPQSHKSCHSYNGVQKSNSLHGKKLRLGHTSYRSEEVDA